MGITNRDLGKAISSTEAAKLRGRVGVNAGNKIIQDLHNSLYHKNGNKHIGYNK